MIVLHAAGINWSRIDGPRTSVPGLVAAQNRLAGCRTALVLTAPSRGRRPELDFPVFDRKIHLGTTGRLDLPTPFDQPNLVVFHSTYLPGNAALARIVRGAGIPYIICPRGGMTRRAQRHRWWKKVLGNRLFFNSFVTHAAALHCLTRGEALESGDWRRPTFVVGNGIDLPSESELASPGSSDSLRLVFVGRLDLALKGLDLLVEACAALRTELLKRQVRIELHGPDWRGGAKRLSAMIRRAELDRLVMLCGPAVGEAKRIVMQRADVFLHTSRSEGHPMAVLEALAYGVPCLLTPATNMADEVAAAGAGWHAGAAPAEIAQGLQAVLAAGRHNLRKAGTRARAMAVREFGWPQVARRTMEAYRRHANWGFPRPCRSVSSASF